MSKHAYKVPVENLPKLRADVEKLARRAARIRAKGYPCDDPGINEGERVIEEAKDKDTPSRVFVLVTVRGSAPKIRGWELIATLQHEESGTILRKNPVATLPDGALIRYREKSAVCDHCDTRRNRRDTYVLHNGDTGETKQVGASCLGDFLFSTNADQLAAYAEVLASIGLACEAAGASNGGIGSKDRVVPLTEFLAFAICSIVRDGWISRTKARETFPPRVATADAAWAWGLFPSRDLPEKLRLHPTDAHRAQADVVASWAESHLEGIPDAAITDYEHNLRVIVRGGFVDGRMAGLAASLDSYRDREIGKAAERAALADSKHFGTVGKRENFTLTIVRLVSIENPYGVSTLHIMRDRLGNVATWKSTRERLEVGREYVLTGTVSKHEEYQGTKQTRLTRCVEFVPKAPKMTKRTKKVSEKPCFFIGGDSAPVVAWEKANPDAPYDARYVASLAFCGCCLEDGEYRPCPTMRRRHEADERAEALADSQASARFEVMAHGRD